MGTRYLPRKLGLDALIKVLLDEHGVMKDGLRRAREAAGRRDFDAVGKTLKELDPVFRQHIADEEASILGLLIRTLGAKGAEAEILVFRQHRPIYQLMQRVEELAALSPEGLEESQADLEALFDGHTSAEETNVFPKASSLGTAGERTGRTGD